MTDPLARFECPDIGAARRIILMPEVGLTSGQRWYQETEWLLPRLIFKPGPILDFGCGIGRLAKHIADAEHPVTGIDTSETMRDQAMRYVDNEHFRVGSPQDLDAWTKMAGGHKASSARGCCSMYLDIRREIAADRRRNSERLLSLFVEQNASCRAGRRPTCGMTTGYPSAEYCRSVSL